MIELREIWKCFPGQSETECALKDLSVRLASAEHIAVVGRSASGKSTLLNILCALSRPTRGSYLFEGQPMKRGGVHSRAARELRRRAGYIGQSSDLLSGMDILSNVKLSASCRGEKLSDATALEWLDRVGLADTGAKVPAQLSGGQRQRVSIARTLACRPRVVFADEPTGSLDIATAREVMDQMFNLTGETGTTLVLVTHAPEFAAKCERQLCIRRGRITGDARTLDAEAIVEFLTQKEPDE